MRVTSEGSHRPSAHGFPCDTPGRSQIRVREGGRGLWIRDAVGDAAAGDRADERVLELHVGGAAGVGPVQVPQRVGGGHGEPARVPGRWGAAQGAGGQRPGPAAKVWLWAIETQGMLLVRRPVAESAAQPEDDDCQESTRSHTHQPHKHTPRGGHAHGHKREEHDHKREEPQRDEWGGLRTFGRLASGVGIGRTSSAVQDAPRRTASADQGKQKTVEVYSMIGEMQPGDAIAWPKLKGQKRAIAKVAQVYKDDVSRLTDVCRHRLVFHSVRQLLTCVQRIITDKDIEIRGVKNSLCAFLSLIHI
eukprot:885685-Rhodomonas_salina.2